ncbi:hypothetical protein L2E82_35604 [Cichorium intybus]|uniref:Uncharacterized protein n=1 Tax=Cichorium intybus TaxID=13427 RepID=A0ACB9BPA8_CICIN|nr:hypothetical protein L2E82_35604 [Cichorium intybus]
MRIRVQCNLMMQEYNLMMQVKDLNPARKKRISYKNLYNFLKNEPMVLFISMNEDHGGLYLSQYLHCFCSPMQLIIRQYYPLLKYNNHAIFLVGPGYFIHEGVRLPLHICMLLSLLAAICFHAYQQIKGRDVLDMSRTDEYDCSNGVKAKYQLS